MDIESYKIILVIISAAFIALMGVLYALVFPYPQRLRKRLKIESENRYPELCKIRSDKSLTEIEYKLLLGQHCQRLINNHAIFISPDLSEQQNQSLIDICDYHQELSTKLSEEVAELRKNINKR
ncbi:MAG: hypothetical protein ACI9AT_000427 [Ulvibacter sp.]|jgi:hypothetical protein